MVDDLHQFVAYFSNSSDDPNIHQFGLYMVDDVHIHQEEYVFFCRLDPFRSVLQLKNTPLGWKLRSPWDG